MENPSKDCITCKGEGWHLGEDGEKVRCECWKRKKVALYLRKLGKYSHAGEEIYNEVRTLDTSVNMHILWDEADVSKINGLLAFLLVQEGLTRDYALLDIYELIDIWFQTHTTWDSVMKLDMDILILKSEKEMVQNASMTPLLVQTMNNRLRLFKPVWFLQKGLYNIYPEVYQYAKDHDFLILDFNKRGHEDAPKTTALK